MSFAQAIDVAIRCLEANGGSRLRRCEECETLNDLTVNPERCYSCRAEWGGA